MLFWWRFTHFIINNGRCRTWRQRNRSDTPDKLSQILSCLQFAVSRERPQDAKDQKAWNIAFDLVSLSMKIKVKSTWISPSKTTRCSCIKSISYQIFKCSMPIGFRDGRRLNSTDVAWLRYRTRCGIWVEFWCFSSLLQEVSPRCSGFSPPMKNQHWIRTS